MHERYYFFVSILNKITLLKDVKFSRYKHIQFHQPETGFNPDIKETYTSTVNSSNAVLISLEIDLNFRLLTYNVHYQRKLEISDFNYSILVEMIMIASKTY